MKLDIEKAREVVETITKRREAARNGGGGADGAVEYEDVGQAVRLLAIAVEEIEALRAKVGPA